MGTNSRQNWSTQHAQHAKATTDERLARAQEQARQAADRVERRNRDLTQNTAFGTSDKPQGFAQTWKTASHKWRWRAVLCVFLALLLVMMQPTGNALYRSWNASNGEMMGLAAAISGDDDSGDLVPAMFAQSEDVPLTTAGASEDNTLLEDGYVNPSSVKNTLTIHKEVSNNSESPNYVPEYVWISSAVSDDDSTPKVSIGSSGQTVFGDGLVLPEKADNKYLVGNEGVQPIGELTNMENGEEVEEPYNSNAGGMGLVSWVGGPNGVIPSADTAELVVDLSAESSYPLGYYVWALGYKLTWRGVQSKEAVAERLKLLGSQKDTGDYTASDFESFKIFSDIVEIYPSIKANDVISNQGAPVSNTDVRNLTPETTTGILTRETITDPQTGAITLDGFINGDVWPRFSVNAGYGVMFSAGFAAEEAELETGSALTWCTDLMSMTEDDNQFEGTRINIPGVSWELYKAAYDDEWEIDKEGAQGKTTIFKETNFVGQIDDGYLGSILNPKSENDPRVDPFYTLSPLHVEMNSAYTSQYVGFVPSFRVTYYANGGKIGDADTRETTFLLNLEDNVTEVEDVYIAYYPLETSDSNMLELPSGASNNLVRPTGKEFFGWSVKEAKDEPDIQWDADSGYTIKVTKVDENGKPVTDTKAVETLADAVEGLVQDIETEDNAEGETTPCLISSIDLYAVWGEDDSTAYTVDLKLADAYDSGTTSVSVTQQGSGDAASVSSKDSAQSFTYLKSGDLTYNDVLNYLNSNSTIAHTDNDTMNAKYATETGEGKAAEAAEVTWALPDGKKGTDTIATNEAPVFTATITPAKYPVTYTIANGTWNTSLDGYDADSGNIIEKVEYGSTPTGVVPAGIITSTDTTNFAKVVPSANYKKADNSYSGAYSATFGTVTGAASYTYTLKKVHDITFEAAKGTTTADVLGGVTKWSSADTTNAATVTAQVFDGDAFSTATDSSGAAFVAPTAANIVAADKYKKAGGDPTTSGDWYSDLSTPTTATLPEATTTITDSATYIYAFKRVWTITLTAATGTATTDALGGVSAWASDNASTADILAQVFNGDAFSAATFSGGASAVPTAPVAAANYYKGNNPAASGATAGGWYSNLSTPTTATLPAAETVVSADATYTYAFKHVWTVELKLGTGADVWVIGNSDKAIKKVKVFDGDDLPNTADTDIATYATKEAALPATGYWKTHGVNVDSATDSDKLGSYSRGTWAATNGGKLVSSVPKTTNITSNGTYTYNFTKVHTIKIVRGTGAVSWYSINAGTESTDSTGEFTDEVFDGENVTTGSNVEKYAISATPAVPGVVESTYYYKQQNLPATPTYADYIAAAQGSWTASGESPMNGTAPKTTDIHADGTYTYNFTPVWTVIYNVVNGTITNGNTTGKLSNENKTFTGEYFDGVTITAPTTAAASNNYEEDGWYRGGDSSTIKENVPNTAISDVNGKTYTYKYKGKNNEVSYAFEGVHPADAEYQFDTLNPDVTGVTLPSTTDVAFGTTVTLPDLTGASADNYEFKGWKVLNGSTEVTVTNPTARQGATFVMPAGSVNVYAQWEIKTVNVTWQFISGLPTDRDIALYYNNAMVSGDTIGTVTKKAEYGVPETKLVAPTLDSGYNTNYYSSTTLNWFTDDAGTAAWTPSSSSAIEENTTRYAKPQDRLYTFTLNTEHGKFKVDGTERNTFTSDGTSDDHKYTYDKLTTAIITAETITNLSDDEIVDDGYAKKYFTWSSNIDPTNAATTLGQGADTGTAAATTDKSFTKTYKPYHTVTFKIYGGTWTKPNVGDATATADSDATVTYYVPDGESLQSAGVLTQNGTDIYTNKGLPTAMANKNGYATSGAWVGSNDGEAGAGTTWAATDVWDTDGNKADSPVTKDKVYVYKFDEASVPYTIHVWYQVATPTSSDQVGTATDYEQSSTAHPGVFTTITGEADYLSNVPIATVMSTNGLTGHLTTNHFTTTRQAPTGTTSGHEGLTADTFTMDNTFTGSTANTKEIYLYFNRETVEYQYNYNNTPDYADSTFATGDASKTTARYDQKITLGAPTVATGKSFNAWYINGGPSQADTTRYAPNSTYTLKADTTFTGEWTEGSYTVSYEFERDADYNGWLSSDPTNFQPKFALTSPVVTSTNVGDPIEETGVSYQRAAAVPKVVFGTDVGNKTYSVSKWYYKRDAIKGGETPTDWTEITSPSAVQIEDDGYHFKAKLALTEYTVTYTAGDHGYPLTPVDNVAQFTKHYGDSVPTVNITADNYGTVGAKEYGDTGSKYYAPEVKSVDATHYQVQQDATKNAAAWSLNSDYADNLLTDNKVGGDLVYDYVWDLKAYNFTFHNVENSSVINYATSGTYSYSGNYNTEAILGTKPAKEGVLTWDDSVFAGLASQENTRKVINPEKSGYVFAGWRMGTATSSDVSAIAKPGEDIKVKDALYNSLTSQHLWASWTGNTVGITYDRNLTGGSNASISWGSGLSTEVKAATATSKDVTVGEKPMLDALSGLKTTGTDSEDFAPAGYTFLGWYENADGSGTKYDDQSTAYEVKPDDAGKADKNKLYAKWKANTYKVQWKDFDNNVLTNGDVWDAFTTSEERAAYFPDKDSLTTEERTQPYQQTFTYNDTNETTATLKSMEKFFTDDTLKATHNSGDNVLKGWSYNSTTIDAQGTVTSATIADGAKISTLTPTDDEVVTLTPEAGDKVTLTYDFNAGTDKVSTTEGGDATPIASQYGKQNSKFTLAPTVYRAGYTFAGWKIGNATYDAGGEWTSGTTDATAVAQWTAEARNLTVRFYKQNGLGSSEYVEDTAAKKTIATFTTGTTVTAGTTADLTDIKLNDQQFPGYSYNSSKGNATTTITADGNASINLYYDMKAYTITYRYTPATGEVAKTTPPRTSEVVEYGNHTLPAIPTRLDANWPVGYAPLDSKWHVMKPKAGGGTEDVAIDGLTLAVGDDIADKEGNIDVVLPWGTEQLTVNFLLSNEAEYGIYGISKSTTSTAVVKRLGDDDETSTAKAVVNYGTTVKGAIDNAHIEVGVSDERYAEGYRFLGWTLLNSDRTISDALVDEDTPVTNGITLVAKISKINSVTWAPGLKSKTGFSTAQTLPVYSDDDPAVKLRDNGPTTFSALSDPFAWSAATLTFPAGSIDIVQPSTSTDENATKADADKGIVEGTLAGKLGWKFKNFTDEDGREYASFDDIYGTNGKAGLTSDAQRKRSYTFTANWEETEQTVTFNSGEGAAFANATVATFKGKTNQSVATDPASTTAIVPAAPAAKTGYTFTGYYVGTFYNDDGTTTSKKLAPGTTFQFPAADATLTAQWTHDKVTVNYESADSNKGTVSTLTTGSIYADGSDSEGNMPDTPITYSVQARPNPGYKFVGWVEANDYEANKENATKLTNWYDPNAAKFVNKGTAEAPQYELNPEYGKLTIQKDNGLYEQATYVALFELDPFNVSFVDSKNSDGDAMGLLTVPAALQNQQIDLNQSAAMQNGTDKIEREASYGYLLNDWSYTVQEEVLVDGVLKIVEKKSSSNIADPTSVGITGDTVFKAEYKPDSAYLLFAANAPEGSTYTESTPSISGLKSGTKVKLPACGFKVEGYTFAGWSTSQYAKDKIAGSEVADSVEFKLAGAQVLYALWTPDTIKVWYSQNGGTAAQVTVPDVVYDAAVAGTPGEGLLSSITAPDYTRGDSDGITVPGAARTFVGWNTNAEGKGTTIKAGEKIPANVISMNVTGEEPNVRLYAQWEDGTYKVSFLPGAGASLKEGKENPAAIEGVVYGQSITLPSASDVYERKGYYFVGWRIENETGVITANPPHYGSTWTFHGKNPLGATDTEVSNVTFTALWEPNPGVDPKVNITLLNMRPIPGVTPNTPNLATFEGLTEDDQPMKSGVYEKLYELKEVTYAADKYFTFKGWYAASIGGANSPSGAFGDNEGVLKIVGNEVTVKDIISKYYGTDQVLKDYYTNESGGKADPPEYWNADPVNTYTDAYKNATRENPVKLRLWRWAELSSYKVTFDANAPWGYTNDQVQGEAMKDQVLDVPGSGAANPNYKLADNTWSFPGYEFLDWQTKPTSGDVLPVQQTNSPAEGSRAVANGATLDAESTALLTKNDTSYEVTLYAVWKPVDYSVSFAYKYPGDGITASTATTEYLGTTKTDYTWGNATGGTTATVVYNPDTVAEPTARTAYSADRPDVTFAGWYTKENDAASSTTEGAEVAVGADTIGGIITKDGSGLTAADTSITLYAKWAVNGARVKYDAGDATGNLDKLPKDKVAAWNDATGAQITVDKNELTKLGYEPDGWTDGTYYYADGTGGTTAGVVNFAGTLPTDQRTVTLTAKFKDKDYTATYNYDAPDGYTSQVNIDGKGAPGKINDVAQTGVSTGLHWDTGRLYSRFDTPPALEGYTFKGFEYRVPNSNKTIPIVADMTVAELAQKIAEANGTTTVSDDLGTIDLYAVWEPATYTVKYELNGGTWSGGADPTTTAIWTSNLAEAGRGTRTLVIPKADLSRAGFSEPAWYVNAACTIPADGLSPDATLAQIAEAWHAANGTSDPLPSTITLYSKWKEDTVKVIFTVSDTSNAEIRQPDSGTAGTDYTMDKYKTQIVYNIGTSTGYINGDPLKGSLPAIYAVAKTGYKVTEWQGTDGEVVSTTASFRLSSPNDGDKYKATTYEAQIAGDATVGVTLKVYVQGTDGAWPAADSPTYTYSDLTASSFGKGLGESIASSALDAKAREKMGSNANGLTFDTSRTPSLEVSSNAENNVASLYYSRAQYDLTFAWAYEEGTPAVPASLPNAQKLYVGQTSTAFAAPTAPEGYEWAGWRIGYTDWSSQGTAYTGTTYTMGNANVQLTGLFKKSSYTVTWGAQVLSASEALLNNDAIAKFGNTPDDVTVDNGKTLNSGVTDENKATAGYRVDISDISGTAVTSTKGNADKSTADVTLNVADGYSVSWKYTMNGKTQYTDDPTSVVITGNVTFTPVVSSGQTVMYRPGEHGTFTTSVSDGTRFVDIPVTQATATTPAQGYKLESYRFPAALKETAAADVNANSGNPQGEPGWVFAGWAYRYVDNNSNIVDSAHDGLAPLSDDALATTAELQNLMHSIELTATWEPATSLLTYDLDDQGDVVGTTKVPAKFTSDAFSKDATPTETGSKVVLPSNLDVDRPGFTLTKWLWTESDGTATTTHELQPGDSITMPNGLLNDNTTLKAVWTEDKAVIEYKPVKVDMGTTVPSKEEIGVWTGTPSGSVATPSRSEYKFVKWTVDGADSSDALTDNNPAFTPSKNAAGMYESATYYASFQGSALKVTFAVATGEESNGRIEDMNGSDVAPTINMVQTVGYGDNASMSDLRVVPVNGWEVADGRYWDYVMYADNNGVKGDEIKHGTTDNPADPNLVIKGHTDFTVHFKQTEGSFPVNYDSREGSAIEPVKRKWTDGNLGANKNPTKVGYTFNGWYTDIPGETAKSTSASDYDEAPGSTAVGTQSYSTLAGNLTTEQAAETGITLRAGWKERTGYSVNFDLNYTGSPAATSVGDISWTGMVTNATVPTRSGYVFTGWYTARNGGTAVVADENGSTQNTRYNALAGSNDKATSQTVYAQWKERTYWVSYVDDNNDQVALKDYKLTGTGLADVAKPRDDTDALRWDGWYYHNDSLGKDVKVGSDTTVEMLAGATAGYDIEANSKDNPLVVKGVWTTYYRYDTKVLLFRNLQDVRDGEDPYGLEKPETVLTQWAAEGSTVKLNFDELPTIPGFTYDKAATQAYLLTLNDPVSTATDAEWDAAFTLDAIDEDYAYDFTRDAPEAGQLFTVVYLAKAVYTVKYNMNDGESHPGGTLTATKADGVDTSDKGDGQLTFLDTGNTPAGWSAADSDTNPTRPGFTFGGWVSPQVADNVEAVDGVNTIVAKDDTPLGDLAYKLVDGVLTWYDPAADGGDGVITLYADWEELHRIVRYIVAEDMKDRVEIRLNSESDDDYGTNERTEVVGAATGDLFEVAGDGTLTRRATWEQGAVARVKRGYSFGGWRVVDSALPSSASYSMPLGAGNPDATAGVLTVASVGQMAAAALQTAQVEAQAQGQASGATAGVTTKGAPSTAVLTIAAAEDTATSTQGNFYSGEKSITPGTRSDNHLFGGQVYGDETDSSASTVLYVATATQNANAPITIDPGEGSYNGSTTLNQPWGTYIGETAPWGDNEGALPASNLVTRPGYTFQGWIIPAGTQYDVIDADGTRHTETFAADTPLKAGDLNSTRIIVPQGGLTLKASWQKASDDERVTHTVTIPETTMSDGTVLPGVVLDVPEGSKLSDEQIENIINRGGYTPEKWVVTYYDPTTGAWVVEKTLTTAELRTLLESLAVYGDITIAPDKNSKVTKYVPPEPRDSWTRPASAVAKTGDNALLAFGASALAILAILALATLIAARRRHD